jgi:hypothetical protein
MRYVATYRRLHLYCIDCGHENQQDADDVHPFIYKVEDDCVKGRISDRPSDDKGDVDRGEQSNSTQPAHCDTTQYSIPFADRLLRRSDDGAEDQQVCDSHKDRSEDGLPNFEAPI